MLSVFIDAVFTGFLTGNSETLDTFRDSGNSTCPIPCTRTLEAGSASLPFVTLGDECLRSSLLGPAVFSELAFAVTETPGRDRPAESGLLGKVVLRFGGVLTGKSVGTTGCCEERTLGELGRDVGVVLRPTGRTCPSDIERLAVADRDGADEVLRGGVDGREVDRTFGEFIFDWTWRLALGEEGLEIWVGRILSFVELGLGEAGRALEVKGCKAAGRREELENLTEDGEGVRELEGLM